MTATGSRTVRCKGAAHAAALGPHDVLAASKLRRFLSLHRCLLASFSCRTYLATRSYKVTQGLVKGNDMRILFLSNASYVVTYTCTCDRSLRSEGILPPWSCIRLEGDQGDAREILVNSATQRASSAQSERSCQAQSKSPEARAFRFERQWDPSARDAGREGASGGAMPRFLPSKRLSGKPPHGQRALSMVNLLSTQIRMLNSVVNSPTAGGSVHGPSGGECLARTAVVGQRHAAPSSILQQGGMFRSDIEITNNHETKTGVKAVLQDVLHFYLHVAAASSPLRK